MVDPANRGRGIGDWPRWSRCAASCWLGLYHPTPSNGRRQLPDCHDNPVRLQLRAAVPDPARQRAATWRRPTHHNPQQLEFVAPPARLLLAAVGTASSAACHAAATAAPCAVAGATLCFSLVLRIPSPACPLVLVFAWALGRQPHHALPALRHLHAARHGTLLIQRVNRICAGPPSAATASRSQVTSVRTPLDAHRYESPYCAAAGSIGNE